MGFISILVVFSLNSFAAINIGTYNIRNFDYDERSQTPTNKSQLVRILKSMDADLLGVQEIHEKRTFSHMIDRNFGRHFQTFLTDCGGAHDQHLGFVVNTSKFEVIHFREDLRTVNVNSPHQSGCHQGSRPLAIIQLKHRKSQARLAAIAVHLKSGGRPNSIRKRFKQIAEVMKVKKELGKQGYDKVIILGDFNTTEFKSKNQDQKNEFNQHLRRVDLNNQTASLKCTSYWWGNQDDGIQYPSHLDHIITSRSLTQIGAPKVYGHCQALACQSSPESSMQVSFNEVSDHCPIAIKLDL